MRKNLSVLISSAAFVVTAAYLTPLYPVYAQGKVPLRAVKGATQSGVIPPVMMQNANGVSDQMLARKEQMASKAAELRLKLQKFKDRNKAKRVENINDNLNNVNTKITDEMQKNLTRISEIVAKLKAWAAEQEAAGKDVSAIKTAITNIESQWTDANVSVTSQADKDYTIAVNSETTVRTDAMTARNNLRTDLNALHAKILSVRQSLISAFTSWKGSTNGQ